jgi:basic membrane protein A
MVSDTGGIDDRSFNASAWAGLQEAAKTIPGVQASFLESKSSADYGPNITAEVAKGCKLIVTVGFTLADATQQGATDNPSIDFALVDSTTTKPLPNVRPLLFSTEQPAFAAGYLAAGMTKSGKLATFGGLDIPPVTSFMTGFYQGMTYYNTQKTGSKILLGWNASTPKNSTFIGGPNAFTDQTKGQQIASNFLTQGADIILPVAGGAGLGAGAAMKAANNPSDALIWVDSDGYFTAPQYKSLFMTTVVKGINIAALDSVRILVANKWTNTPFQGTLKNKGVSLAPYHDWASKIPTQLKTDVAKVQADIASGTITVNP